MSFASISLYNVLILGLDTVSGKSRWKEHQYSTWILFRILVEDSTDQVGSLHTERGIYLARQPTKSGKLWILRCLHWRFGFLSLGLLPVEASTINNGLFWIQIHAQELFIQQECNTCNIDPNPLLYLSLCFGRFLSTSGSMYIQFVY